MFYLGFASFFFHPLLLAPPPPSAAPPPTCSAAPPPSPVRPQLPLDLPLCPSNQFSTHCVPVKMSRYGFSFPPWVGKWLAHCLWNGNFIWPAVGVLWILCLKSSLPLFDSSVVSTLKSEFPVRRRLTGPLGEPCLVPHWLTFPGSWCPVCRPSDGKKWQIFCQQQNSNCHHNALSAMRLKQNTCGGKHPDAGRPKIVEKLIGCYGRRVTVLTQESNIDQILNCIECRLYTFEFEHNILIRRGVAWVQYFHESHLVEPKLKMLKFSFIID